MTPWYEIAARMTRSGMGRFSAKTGRHGRKEPRSTIDRNLEALLLFGASDMGRIHYSSKDDTDSGRKERVSQTSRSTGNDLRRPDLTTRCGWSCGHRAPSLNGATLNKASFSVRRSIGHEGI